MSAWLYPLYVMIGGAIGALLRYGVYEAWRDFQPTLFGLPHFPWPTFLINMLGSFLFGLLAAAIPHLSWGESLRALFLTGVLGAFTTFSTFSFELFSLMQQGEFKIALLYSVLSVMLGIISVFVGYTLRT
jgi:fluoride exporter